MEAEIIDGRLGKIPDKTFSDLIDRYKKEVTPQKRGERAESLRLMRALDDDIASVKLANIDARHVASWRDRRLAVVSSASVNREWNTLCHACSLAIKEWRWLKINPFSEVKRPAEPPPRQRLIAQEEVALVLHVCGSNYSTAMGRVGLAFEFALETAMRAGEICSLAWADVHADYVHLAMTKNGSSRDVPLTAKAVSIISTLNEFTAKEETVFALSARILDALFRKAKKKANVEGFTFHDSRATALTKLSRKLNVLQLAKVSGHRDISILQKVYYRETASDIAKLI